MDRLIKKYEELLIKDNDNEYISICSSCKNISKCDKKKCGFYRALKKLEEYEDLEEQGRLLKLPCVPNDRVWKINDNGKITNCGVSVISVYESGVFFSNAIYICNLNDFGKTVFLSREEAESALAVMKLNVERKE